ncbi:MAG: para-nitrobenzyl esterase, partial [Gammaproteobacteria bacterium]
MDATRNTIAQTKAGSVQGRWRDGAYEFNAIPYAAPPTGERRFRAPEPVSCWSGLRSAVTPGPIPPQTPSRLARVLGDYDLAQGEDCLHVNVVTPELDGAKRPVVVWLFGGAFLSGGNAIPWYDGGGFARHHDI